MKSGDRYVTKEFVQNHRKAIQQALNFETYSRFSPRRIIVEMAREEFRYSDTTLPADIWHSIVLVYKNNL